MISLLLGGARSGKSEVAEALASRLPQPVIYVATAAASDEEMEGRIRAHRARRPSGWRTVEVPGGVDLGELLRRIRGSVLVDSVGTWLAGVDAFNTDPRSLCRDLVKRGGDTVLVSDEVGLGVHPGTEAGRRFRDALGVLNRHLAEAADQTLLVVAGMALRLEPIG